MITNNIKNKINTAKKTSELVIRNEKITEEIWSEIFKLKNLLRLELYNNQIIVIPKQIEKLTNLKKLSFGANLIEEIPIEIGKLTKLHLLYLWQNKIKKLPKQIGKLTNLEELYLWENQISEIPTEIGKLTNLIKLNFGNNRLNKIPKEIEKLVNLHKLNLGNNQIKEVPVEISSLTYLKKLYLNNNQIVKIPPEIVKLHFLHKINISGNPISIPNEFEITNFKLFKNLKLINLSDKINIIIGKNVTGKTTLLQAITFALSNEYNTDIDTRTLKNYIKKNSKNSVLRAVFHTNISKELVIFQRLQDISKYTLINTNLLLAYGTNLFHKKEIINNELLKELISGSAKNYSIFSIFENFSDKFIDPTLILNEIKKQSELEIKQVFELLLKTLNEFLAIQEIEQFQIVWDRNGFYYQEKNTKDNFILSDLSEGYRSNILLISDILIRILSARKQFATITDIFNNIVGTILIDEFDKHLHSTWLSLFISKLIKLLPKVQFILTTHNIDSVSKLENGTAIVLQTDKNGKIFAETKEL